MNTIIMIDNEAVLLKQADEMDEIAFFNTQIHAFVPASGLPTSEILFPYFVEKNSVFWVTFPYPLICSSPDSKHSLGNFLFTLVGPIHSQWKL